MVGSNTYLNVLGVSLIFNDIMHDKTSYLLYVVNGKEYKFGYYRGDGIFFEYAIFVKEY